MPTPLKLGIIGDVHAEHHRLTLTLDYLYDQGINQIACTGDLSDGAGDLDKTVEILMDHNVTTVAGNHDRWLLTDRSRHVTNAHHRSDLNSKTLEYLESLPKTRTITVGQQDVLLCHGMGDQDLAKIWPGTERMPVERSSRLDDIIDQGRFSWIINGHVHFQSVIPFETAVLINAGTLAGNRWPGFLILDLASQTIDVFSLADNQVTFKGTRDLSMLPRTWKNTQHFDGDWDPTFLIDTTATAA